MSSACSRPAWTHSDAHWSHLGTRYLEVCPEVRCDRRVVIVKLVRPPVEGSSTKKSLNTGDLVATLAVTRRLDLADEQWARLEPLLPVPARSGRPSEWTKRQLIDGIRWRVRVGARPPLQPHRPGGLTEPVCVRCFPRSTNHVRSRLHHQGRPRVRRRRVPSAVRTAGTSARTGEPCPSCRPHAGYRDDARGTA
jgi:transposase